jgi:hypothetical protein
MPIGFPAYHEDTAPFRGRTRAELRAAVEDALDELRWTWRRDGKWRIVASVPASVAMFFPLYFVTWGANFTVEVDEEELFLHSEGSIAIAWLDLGQHAANIRKFLEAVDDRLEN